MSQTHAFGSMPVSTFMATDVVSVGPAATLAGVIEALAEGEVGAVVIRDGPRVVGVVSERDVVRALAARCDPGTEAAVHLASRKLVWCDETASVAEVAEQMMEQYVRHVLVERDGRLVGIVSARDLLGVYATADEDLMPPVAPA